MKKNSSLKVAVGLSGGVDSGVAAALLVKKGFACSGFFLRFWKESKGRFENKCCDSESLEAARKTCWQLGIPFYVLDFSDIFKKKVVDYFLAEYASGRTPNPCVMCNKYIKFGRFLEYVKGLGYDYLATGHYARKYQTASSKYQKETYHLLMGKDKSKDQGYFLYGLTQEQLASVLFPVGDYTKKEIRRMAKEWKLPVAQRPESQEVCFFPESDYRPFLRRQIPEKLVPGEVVDTEGRVIGRHFGLPLYTIGQRHGFEINDKGAKDKSKKKERGIIPPYYVIEKDIKNNRLVVGFGKETEKREFWVKNVNWINPLGSSHQSSVVSSQSSTIDHRPLTIDHQPSTIDCRVRIRHQGELLKVERIEESKNKLKVILIDSYRGIAPGQAAVFYQKLKIKNSKFKIDDWEVLGGGIIDY